MSGVTVAMLLVYAVTMKRKNAHTCGAVQYDSCLCPAATRELRCLVVQVCRDVPLVCDELTGNVFPCYCGEPLSLAVDCPLLAEHWIEKYEVEKIGRRTLRT